MSSHKKRNIDQHEGLLIKEKLKEAYDINVASISKMPNYYKIIADNKRYKLEKTAKSPAEWSFSKTISKHLTKKGFDKIIRVEETKYGEILININKQNYILTHRGGFKTFKFYNEGSIEKLVDFMCKFNEAAEGCFPEAGTRVQVSWGKLLLKSKNCVIGMKRFINKARSNMSNEDFDRLIIKYGEMYLKRAEEAYKMLKESKYITMVEESMKKSQLCIGSFSGKRLVASESEIQLMYMDRCCYDLSCTDVARVIVKCKNNPLWCKRFIDAYINKNYLSQDELLVIYCMILSDDGVYKLCKRYYDSNNILSKQEVTIRLVNLIENQINEKDILYYIESLMKRGELSEYI